MSSVNDIRRAFLDYFAAEGHEIVASSPLVPRNDPTLMFTNAGMVQFKDYFTGKAQAPYPRAVTSQKCVRAGGKHNDLDNVGYTARHHTFFEMLGNFSFGDYFKERAIDLAWTLITREFGLAKERLLVTVYAEDDDAHALWKKVAGLPDDRIIRIPTSDNFWAMGDTGPCGPCSEIFYDHGDHIWGGPPGSPEEDGDRFVEIWNLVFMQFEQVTTEERVDLPRPSIDTGMGLERIAAVLQGVHDNYDIDLFKALIAGVNELPGVDVGESQQASPRVIADHLRATSFLIADGVLPSNEGRGYVLRRIMRRAMRHAHMIGIGEPAIYRLVPLLVREMGQAYPELGRAEALISETLKLEEGRFQKTLARGLSLLDQATESLGEGDTLDGETAFKLYDTYGFPLDLTQDALKTRSIGVDLGGFNDAMQRQKAEARANWAGSGDAATETIWLAVRDRVGATDFLGYDTVSAEGVVQALVRDGAETDTLSAGEEGALITNQTPFYGESGGQVGDTGTIETEGGARFAVTDTQKKADGLFVHLGRIEEGKIGVGDAVRLSVDAMRRTTIRANHSATHLLHEALRETLGGHVAQKGSLVAPDRLRFDFSHPKPVGQDELARITDRANQIVLQDAPVVTRLMDREAAIESGAMALFGEKYGDEVRVVSMGEWPDGERAGKTYSLELCGGTHVRRTGEIGVITVVSEAAVAAGVRRIEALTGDAARRHLSEQDQRVRDIALKLKVRPEDVLPRLDALLEERRKLERDLAEANKKLAMGGGGGGEPAVRQIGSINLMARAVEGVAPKDLRGLVDQGKQAVGSGIVAIVGINDGKAGLIVGVTDDLTDRISAVDLVQLGSVALGGRGGGGRPDLAQAGGPNAAAADEALKVIAGRVEELAA
ncbi:MAG TPA: alanine--tRNA ligase [Afifellaceae bacterium]|nr:alanine--tRNA ligase [Afifellaceae bacterium]